MPKYKKTKTVIIVETSQGVITFMKPSAERAKIIMAAVAADDELEVHRLHGEREAIDHDFRVIDDETVMFRDYKIHIALAARVVKHIHDNVDVTPLVRFCEKLYSNPNPAAVEDLFAWLSKCDLPITTDGDILAYKRVRQTFYDFHTNTMLNAVGTTVSMPREETDPSRYNECSTGLHFCSKSYLNSFYSNQGRTLVLKISPADVVAIPTDYNRAKGRACSYYVVGELSANIIDSLVWNPVEDVRTLTTPEEHIAIVEAGSPMDPARLAPASEKADKDADANEPAPADEPAEPVRTMSKREVRQLEAPTAVTLVYKSLTPETAKELGMPTDEGYVYVTPIGWVTERQMTIDLAELSGNITELAEHYQISRSTLFSRLQSMSKRFPGGFPGAGQSDHAGANDATPTRKASPGKVSKTSKPLKAATRNKKQ